MEGVQLLLLGEEEMVHVPRYQNYAALSEVNVAYDYRLGTNVQNKQVYLQGTYMVDICLDLLKQLDDLGCLPSHGINIASFITVFTPWTKLWKLGCGPRFCCTILYLCIVLFPDD